LKAVSIQLILLLLFSGFLSCNKVSEIPEPDFFAQNSALPEISVKTQGDSAEIDLLAGLSLDFPVSIAFEKPANGQIVPKSDGKRFIYKPNAGFEGWDTVSYKLCRSSQCRQGAVFVEVLPAPNTCSPVYNMADTLKYSLVSAPGAFAIPLFQGDSYCPENIRKIVSGSLAGISNLRISDSIRFSSGLSRSQARQFTICYTNSDKVLGEKKRFIKVSLQPQAGFCDDFFDVLDQESFLYLERDEFIIVNKSSFRALVQACDGDLDPDFFELRSTQNIGIIPFENDSYKVFFKPYSFQGPARLFYRYRNLRGISDEGSLKIILH
jgi:hypothetical protein